MAALRATEARLTRALATAQEQRSAAEGAHTEAVVALGKVQTALEEERVSAARENMELKEGCARATALREASAARLASAEATHDEERRAYEARLRETPLRPY